MTEHTRAGRASAGDRIIEATLELIARDGLGGITMTAIADAAGVSRQTLYNHYADVDGILVDALARHNAESLRLLESALAVVEDAEGKLAQLVRHMVMVGAHAQHAPGLEHSLSERARQPLRDHDASVDATIREILTQGQADGSFRADLDLEVDAALVRSLLAGLADQAARSPEAAATLAAVGSRTLLAAVGAR